MNPQEVDPMQQAYMEAAQQGQANDPSSLYADYMKQEEVKNVIQQLNPDVLVEDIEHRIRGEKKDRFTGEWVPISKEGTRISELLIQRYISFLSSYLNQNTSLSNYSTREINNLMKLVVDHIKYDLSDNSEEYGFVKINEVETYQTVKELKRELQKDGTTKVRLIPKVIKQLKVIEEETDFNEMNRIAMIICGTTFSVLKRAQNGMEARRVFSTFKMTEAVGGQQQKKGLADIFRFWS
jgi:hypothetical protein